MYKCRECGQEFEIKPEYCDCGNDTFDEIVTKLQVGNDDVTNVTELNETQEIISETKTEIVNEETYKRPSMPSYDYSRLKQFFDPISTTIFIICLLLAWYVVKFAGNSFIKDSTKEVKNTTNTEKPAIKNIPDIEKIWNSTPPTPSQIEVRKDAQETVPASVLNKLQEQLQPQNKPEKQVAKPKAQKVQKIEKLPNQSQNVQYKINAQREMAKANARAQAKTQSSKSQTQVLPTKPSQNKVKNKQELESYKISLRNRLASRIDFARVVGDGECIVAFKIDANGKLINRSFQVQSENYSLNDVVYNAVMSLPNFNVPPKAYSGELLHLKVRMYGGNFEVYLY